MYTYKATIVRPSTRMRFARKRPAMGLKDHLISAGLAALIVAAWYGVPGLL
jgi:hypothetical protein